MILGEFYKLLDKGDLETIFESKSSSERREMLEQELWKAFFALEAHGNMELAVSLITKVKDDNNKKDNFIDFFVNIIEIQMVIWKGEYSKVHFTTLEKELNRLKQNNEPGIDLLVWMLYYTQGQFFFSAGNFSSSRDSCEKGLSDITWEKIPLKLLQPMIKLFLGASIRGLGDLAKSQKMFKEILTIFEELGNELLQSHAYLQIGWTYAWLEDPIVMEYIDKSLTIARKTKYQRMICFSLGMLAWMNQRYGDLDKAYSNVMEADRLTKRLKNPFETSLILMMKGLIYNSLGRVEDAKVFYEECIEIYEKEKPQDIYHGATKLYLGIIYWGLGDLRKAEELITWALEFFGDENVFSMYALSALGDLYFTQGEVEKAENMYKKAMGLFKIFGWFKEWIGDGIREYQMMQVHLARGEVEEAEEIGLQGLALSEKKGSIMGIANGNSYLIELYLNQDKVDKAEEMVKKFGQIVEEKNVPFLNISYLLVEGSFLSNEFDLKSARKKIDDAKQIAVETHHFDLLVKSIRLLIKLDFQLFMNSKRESHKQQLKQNIIELQTLSEKENIHSGYIETLLIEGMMKKMEFDLPGAIEIFNTAETLASTKGLQSLADRAVMEIQQISSQTKFLRQMMDTDPDKYRDIQMTAIQSYIAEANKIVEREANLKILN